MAFIPTHNSNPDTQNHYRENNIHFVTFKLKTDIQHFLVTANSSWYANELSVIMGISRLESLKHGGKVAVLVLYLPVVTYLFEYIILLQKKYHSSCDALPSLRPTE